MYDILPFPNITGSTTQEQLAQVNNYLIQFKEELEFILTNISADNLSGDLKKQLNALGANVDTYKVEQRDATEQIVKNSLTVSDVLNSTAYNADIKRVYDEIDRKVKTVENKIPAEYLVSAEQTKASDESGGINLYAIEDSTGTIHVLQVMNGKTPNVAFTVNFETGNLEYTTS